jgi:hypothetical protein
MRAARTPLRMSTTTAAASMQRDGGHAYRFSSIAVVVPAGACAVADSSSRQRRRASFLRSRAHVVPMHRTQRLRPSGLPLVVPEQSSRRPRPRRLPARGSGKLRKAARELAPALATELLPKALSLVDAITVLD